MRFISFISLLSFIEEEDVIEKILKHLGLWDLKVRPSLKAKASSVTIPIDDSDSRVPFSVPPLPSGPRIPRGFLQNFKPARGVGFSRPITFYHLIVRTASC